VPDFCDPCPQDNPDDSDGDGVCDTNDICPGGDDAVDGDADGVPDFCDPCPFDNPDDTDGDGVCDTNDVCPGGDDAIDGDGDGVPDFCDVCPLDNPDDTDGDGVCDTDDICPGGDDTIDTDGDGVPDFCDVCPLDDPDDTDGDLICDSDDACPTEYGEGADGCPAGDTTPPTVLGYSSTKQKQKYRVTFQTDETATGEVCTVGAPGGSQFCVPTGPGASHDTGYQHWRDSQVTITVTDAVGNAATYGPYAL
jgi:hypothetical protein